MSDKTAFEIVATNDELMAGYFAELYTSVPKIQQIYTGTGFDSSITTTGYDEDSHELDVIPASKTANATYARVRVLYNTRIICDRSSTSDTSIKLQVKEVGGIYYSALGYKYLWYGDYTNDSREHDRRKTDVFEYLHTLTSDEKTKGIQFNIFSKSQSASNDGAAYFTNIRTIVELI